MKCKSCGFENEYTEKYCFICGRALYNHMFTSNNFNQVSQTAPVRGSETSSDSINRERTQLTPPASEPQSVISTNPSLPMIEPNQTFYFANPTAVTIETPAEREPALTDGDSAGQAQAETPEILIPGNVTDKPAKEETLGLRFSLERLIHGNIRPAANESASLPTLPGDSAVDLRSVELVVDHKNLSYHDAGLVDDNREPSIPQPVPTVEVDVPVEMDDSSRPRSEEDEGYEKINPMILETEAVSKADNANAAFEDGEETNAQPERAELPEILPEPTVNAAPEQSSAKSVFHMNGFVISDATTFVRPLFKPSLTPMEPEKTEAVNTEEVAVPEMRRTVAEETEPTEIQDAVNADGLIIATAEVPDIQGEADVCELKETIENENETETETETDTPEAAASVELSEVMPENTVLMSNNTEEISLSEIQDKEDTREFEASVGEPSAIQEETINHPDASEFRESASYGSIVTHQPESPLEDMGEFLVDQAAPELNEFHTPNGFDSPSEKVSDHDADALETTDTTVAEMSNIEAAAATEPPEVLPVPELSVEPVEVPSTIAEEQSDEAAESVMQEESAENDEIVVKASTSVMESLPADEIKKATEMDSEMLEEQEQPTPANMINPAIGTIEIPIESSPEPKEEDPGTKDDPDQTPEPLDLGDLRSEPQVTPILNNDAPQPMDTALSEIETAVAIESNVQPEIGIHQGPAVLAQEPTEPEFADDLADLSVAEFNWLWKRCGATFADTALLGLPIGLLFSVLKGDSVAFVFLLVIVYWLYSILFEASGLQATPGKLLFGLIVADQNGKRLSFLQANNRFFAKILSGVLLRVITEKNQCLHDVLSKTLVLGG